MTTLTMYAVPMMAAMTAYAILPLRVLSASCRPKPPLMMPRMIAKRPMPRCIHEEIVRRLYLAKSLWWSQPKMGWKKRMARRSRPMMAW